MSEPEFEMYLSLMSKFLRLTSTQKADIAEEMRIHLEERLAELMAQGKSREEAIHLALDEFGDAGALAWQFTLPHHIRRRRMIMRYSVGSFVAVAGIFALVSLMWPHRPDHPPMMMQAVAQGGAEQPAENSPRSPEDSAEMERQKIRREIEKKLESRGHEIDFNGSLGQAIEFLGHELDLDFHFDKGLEADNIAVSLKARQGSLSAATTLELLLRQCEDASVIYVIKDGIVLITNGNADYEVQVYDCRDLLANMSFPPAMGGMGGGMMGGGGMGGGMGGMGGGMGGQFSVPTELLPAVMGQFGGGLGGNAQAAPADDDDGEEGGQPQNQPGRGGMGGGMMGVGGGGGGVRPAGGMGALITVIQQATRPAQWEAFDGDGGTMSAFDGMLVVRHNQAVHRKIEEVFEKLRMAKQAHGKAAKQEQVKATPLVIPPGKRLVTVNANGWQVPANAFKVGSRVDVITTKLETIDDLEVSVIDGAGMGFGDNPILIIQSLGFLVTPEQAMELKLAENQGPLQFLLRGDDDSPIEPKIKNTQKTAPSEIRSELVIPAGKRLVTIPLGNWQIAAEQMKAGERVELYEVSGAETTQLDLAFSDLEVAAFSTKQQQSSSPPSDGDEPFELVETLSFVVEPPLALQLQQFQERLSKNGSMVGVMYSQVRGEKENKRAPGKKNAPPETRSEAKPPASGGVADLQSAFRDFSLAVSAYSPSHAEVLASLPERARHNVRITVEPLALRLDQPRFYPMVGSAQLIHCHYKCTVHYDVAQPAPNRAAESLGTEVVYIDHDHLVRADVH